MIEWILVICRFIQYLSCDVLFGSALFFLYSFNCGIPSTTGFTKASCRRLLLTGAWGIFFATLIWLFAETGTLSDDSAGAPQLSLVWSVVSETHFGTIAALRLGLAVISIAALFNKLTARRQWVTQSVIGCVLVASFGWTGHAAMHTGNFKSLHLANDVVHLWAAALWLGALIPLSTMLFCLRPEQEANQAVNAAHALARFSGLGPAVVALLVLTGTVNTGFMVGLPRWHDLIASAYCRTLLAKVVLFCLMIPLAAANRYVFSPRLTEALEKSESPLLAMRSLRASVKTETILAVLVTATVGLLGTLEPPS